MSLTLLFIEFHKNVLIIKTVYPSSVKTGLNYLVEFNRNRITLWLFDQSRLD